MRILILLPLLLVACAKYELSPAKTEPAIVVQTFFTASHSETSVSLTVDGDINVDTDTVPAQFGVMFRCQHGEFVIQGHDPKHADLWKRFSKGDRVTVHYQEKFKITKTSTNFYDFVFLRAEKVALAELDF